MLTHTSGLIDSRNVDNNEEFYMTAKDKENFEPIKKNDSLNFEPGQKYMYSNPAFNGLALIIENVTNTKWQDYIKEKIFIPSGMANTTITDGSYPEKGVSHGYIYENNRYSEYDYGEFPTFAAAGNGGVWSSVLELAKYEIAIHRNVFLSKELTKESRYVFRPENWADTLNPYVGYSWFIGEESLFGGQSKFGVNFIYHTGSQGGFRSFYITIPEKDIIFIGLFNRPLKDFRKLIMEGITLFEKHNWIE